METQRETQFDILGCNFFPWGRTGSHCSALPLINVHCFAALFNCIHFFIDHIVCNGTFAEEDDDCAVKRG